MFLLSFDHTETSTWAIRNIIYRQLPFNKNSIDYDQLTERMSLDDHGYLDCNGQEAHTETMEVAGW